MQQILREMCCLGIIYTDSKSFVSYKTIEVRGIDSYECNESIPTLIIGKKNAEKLFGVENIKVLNKQIKENLYWTFSKFERRSEYEKDIEAFYSTVFSSIMKKLKYTALNIYTLPYSKIRNSINYINNKTCKKVALITNNHVYINFETTVLGISIDELNYIGITKDKFVTFLKKNNIVIYYSFQEYNEILKKYFNFNKIVIPYLLKNN